MGSDDFAFWLLTLGFAVAGGGALSLRWLQIARLIEDTPTSRLRSAAQGYVELEGRGRPLDGTTNPAPLTRRPCVWWRYRITHREQGNGGRGDRWNTVASGESSQPFLLDDGTGRCIVKPDGAEVLTSESTTWYGDTPWPGPMPDGVSGPREREYRYFEERIYEHESLYVLGAFSTHGAGADGGTGAAVATLLAGWKDDQAALVQRFDEDRDGKVSVQEWARAREEARRTVEQQQRDRPPVAALNVLSRPESGQLFLIAAMHPRELARRYRRRAVIAFVGFVAAVCALGWLLQGALGGAPLE